MHRIHLSRLAAGFGLAVGLMVIGFSPGTFPAAFAQETAAADPAAAADDAPEPLSEDELEVLVARIVLYPDEFVAVVTSASLYPLQIIEAARYLEQANVIGNDRTANIRNKPGNISVKDVRNSKIDADRINRDKVKAARPNVDNRKITDRKPAQNRRPDTKINKPAGNIKAKANFDRPVSRPKPAGRLDNRPRKPSALGHVDSGRRTQMQSNRGRQAMGGGGHRGGRGGHQIQRGGGRHR